MTYIEDGYEDGFKKATLIISILITIFGFFGNFVVIFVITTLKEYKKSITHWYILQLAIADTIFLLRLPFNASEDWTGSWAFSDSFCKFKEAALYLNFYASIFFLIVMSIDRYIAICWSQSSIASKIRNKKVAYSVTAVIWIACLLLCIPLLLYSHKSGEEPDCTCGYEFPITNDLDRCKVLKFSETLYQRCLDSKKADIKRCSYPKQLLTEYSNTTVIPNPLIFAYGSGDVDEALFDYSITNNNINAMNIVKVSLKPGCHYYKSSKYLFTFLYFNFFGLFVAPFVIMVVCYGLIVKQIFVTQFRSNTSVSTSSAQTSTSIKSNRHRSRTQADKDRLRVTIMCAALVLSFVIFWLPHHAVHLAKIVGITGASSAFCENIQVIARLISYLNSALNPYLYSFLGKQFFRRLSLAYSSLKMMVGRNRISSNGSSFGMKQKNSRSKTGSSSNKTKTTKFQRNKLGSKNTGSFSQQNIEEIGQNDGTRFFHTSS